MILSGEIAPRRDDGILEEFHSGRHVQNGSSTVEVSMTILAFLFIIFLIFDGAIFIYNAAATEYLAGLAVNYAIRRGVDADVESIKTGLPADDNEAKAEIVSFIKNKNILVNYNKDDINVTVTFTDGSDDGALNRNPGDRVKVNIQTTYKSVWPMVSDLFNVTLDHSAEGTYIY